jgi:alanine dehydrogenase
MLVLTRHDVEQTLTMSETIAAVEDGFRQLALGNVVMPQRIATVIAPHNGIHLSMPAFVSGDPGTLAIKIVTVYSDNPVKHDQPTIQGVLLLHDAVTGGLLALMDAEHLTAMRTGAVSGVATRHLARPDARIAAIFGSGVQATTQLLAVCAERPVARAYVFSLNEPGDLAYAARMTQELGIPVARATSARAAVEAADIICTATNSATPLFDGAWVRPGTHINAIGAYTRTTRELDSTTVQRGRVYVDGRLAAQTEAGDIVIPIGEGVITVDHIVGELGALLVGQIAGRTAPEQITIFKSVGMAVQDAVTAARVYARAQELGIGQQIEL